MDSLDNQLQETIGFVEELRKLVPAQVDSDLPNHNSPLPLRLFLTKGVHLHRILDLAESSIFLVRDHRPMPAIVVARACLESAAVLSRLVDRTVRFLDDDDADSYNKFLERAALGSKNDDTPFDSTNTLTYMGKLEKKFPGVERFYVDLCEQAHPNWAGTAPYLAFGDDAERVTFDSPGEDFEMMVPTPVSVATRIAIDAAERLVLLEERVRAIDT